MSNDFPFDQFFNFKEKSASEQIMKTQQFQEITPIIQELNTKSGGLNSDFDHSELELMTSELLSHLKSKINENKFNAYFDNTFQIKSISDQTIICTVTTSFIKKIIESHYKTDIESAIENFLGKSYALEIEIMGESLKNETSLESTSVNDLELSQFKEEYTVNKAKSIKETSFSINENDLFTPSKKDLMGEIDSKVINHMENKGKNRNIDPKKSFENFIVGPSNSFAHAASMGAAKAPGKVYPSLYLYGNSGLGKTHLLHAVGNYINQNNSGLRVCIITANDFMNEIVNAIKSNTIPEFRNR